MGSETGVSNSVLSLRTQGRLDGILSTLVTDLRGVIPEHEVVLSLASATRWALLAGVSQQNLPDEVDAAVRATWGLAIARPDLTAGSTDDGRPRRAAAAAFMPARADAGVGLLQIGADLRITAMDGEAAGVLGVNEPRLAAISALTLVAPSYRPLVATLMQRTGDGASWSMVVPMRHEGGYRPTLMATATVSGASPRMWACAVTRVEADSRIRPLGESEAAPDGPAANHCLIECAVAGGLDTYEALSGIATQVSQALGPGPLVRSDGDRITVLLPAAGGTLEALRHGDQIAHLVRALCKGLGPDGTAEVHTNLVCVGSRTSLARLLTDDGYGG